MSKYLVVATRSTEYQVEVEAANEYEALESLRDWIDDDFQPHLKFNQWDFDVQEYQ